MAGLGAGVENMQPFNGHITTDYISCTLDADPFVQIVLCIDLLPGDERVAWRIM